jgi:proteasome lid subunit RPN8/RPN11
MIQLVLSKILIQQIQRDGIAAYPNECCGILFGRDVIDAPMRIVEEIQPVENVFDAEERHHRFSISPKQLIDGERLASERNQLVLGFYHSHPDHPARPSDYDRLHAWPFYSYVIVSVVQREAAAITSWMLNEAAGEFEEQPIVF